jgi:WhiB family redox-sensing transcriptional regulator
MEKRNGLQCRRADVDPDLFYSKKASNIEAAKALCAACAANSACLLESFAVKGEEGIWGGKTKEEREELRARILGQRDGEAPASPAPTQDDDPANDAAVNDRSDTCPGRSSKRSLRLVGAAA